MIFVNLIGQILTLFFAGIGVSKIQQSPLVVKWHRSCSQAIASYLLWTTGLKGAMAILQHGGGSLLFLNIAVGLVIWGFAQPFLAYVLLKRSGSLDRSTVIAIAGSFGSISVMTFVSAVVFLDQLQVGYHQFMIAILALMEIPGIGAGLFMAKLGLDWKKIGREILFNPAIVTLMLGFLSTFLLKEPYTVFALTPFKIMLGCFLFDIGMRVGQRISHLKRLSWKILAFGIYMPLIGAVFGLLFSQILGLDRGTAVLIAVLCASASYIVAPAIFRIALPEAQESVYLSLSLAIAFPFNIVIGIPLYHHIATVWLKQPLL